MWRVFPDEVSFARVAGLQRDVQPGDHAVLVYTDVERAADFCSAFLRDGLAIGERLIIALPDPLRPMVIDRFAPEELSDAVVLDSREVYGPDFDPEATIQEFESLVRSDEPARFVCAMDPETAATIDVATFQHYERIAHQLVLELNATALCVYDGQRLPIGFSPVAVHTHPLISRDGSELRRNPDFAYEPTGSVS